MIKKFFLTCIMGYTLIGTPTNVNAQTAKVLTKGAKAISKVVSKSGGKAVSKGGTSTSKGATKSSSTLATEAEKAKTARPITYTCTTCNGAGKIRSWNSYRSCYITSDCSNCHGKGKITRIVRY